jgi:hypothetical protein
MIRCELAAQKIKSLEKTNKVNERGPEAGVQPSNIMGNMTNSSSTTQRDNAEQ